MASALLIGSYVLDWALLIVFAAVGFVVGNITPNKRPFHIDDPNISFPYTGHDTVSVAVLFVASVVAPAVIIFLMAMVLVPGSTVPKGTPPSYVWRRKLWEWHAGWLGLGLSLVTAWFFTSGMKNLLGKPRPNLLNRCRPDYANVALYVVSGFVNNSTDGQLVTSDICKNPDRDVVDEGFRSFPSGHSSVSAAGLVFLSLLLAAKLGAGAPFLSYNANNHDGILLTAFPSRIGLDADSQTVPVEGVENSAEMTSGRQSRKAGGRGNPVMSARRQAAGAPVYLVIIALVPFATAVFISSSRWFDFQHHGFDIIFGFLIGTLTSIFAFRHYHLPLGRGGGWAWGSRINEKAFWAGTGNGGFSTPNTLVGYNDSGALASSGRRGDISGNEVSRESYELRDV